MDLFVYEAAVDYETSSEFLADIRQTVKQLKANRPELKDCSLADLTVKKGKTAINVTLYFQPES